MENKARAQLLVNDAISILKMCNCPVNMQHAEAILDDVFVTLKEAQTILEREPHGPGRPKAQKPVKWKSRALEAEAKLREIVIMPEEPPTGHPTYTNGDWSRRNYEAIREAVIGKMPWMALNPRRHL